MTKKEEIQLRKHIKPFIKFALVYYKNMLRGFYKGDEELGMCEIARCYEYNIEPKEFVKHKDGPVTKYIKQRLRKAKPKTASKTEILWWDFDDIGIQNRIKFLKYELKHVKVKKCQK